MEVKKQNIGLIYITYYPTKEEIEKINHFANIYKTIIVDNTPAIVSYNINSPISQTIYLGKNLGVAKAQNIGFDTLLKDSSIKYFLLFDQDTDIPDEYPINIANQFCYLSNYYRLAALGPMVIQKEKKEVYHSIIHKYKINDTGLIIKDEIIASGCCISRTALEEIGKNDERLFIDFVDCDWCFRAKEKGYVCGMTNKIEILHKVGIEQKKIFGHTIIISAPFRYRYQYRNLIILNTKSYVPFGFKFYKSLKAIIQFIYFPFLIKNGYNIWKNMCKGIYDGLKYIIVQKND